MARKHLTPNQMNTDQKQRFFASYYGVACAIKIGIENLLYRVNAFVLNNQENYKLQLTHPSKITDAHCVELFDLVYPKERNDLSDSHKVECVKYWLSEMAQLDLNKAETIISFLRLNGYIFQFEGMSIDELVESGEVELK